MGASGSKEEDAIHVIHDHTKAINCMAISEDKSLIATGSDDHTVRMWSTKADLTESLGVLRGHTSYVTCLTISDTYLVSGAADKTVRKWDMATGVCIFVYEGHTHRILRVLCTGDFIFSSSYDKTVRAWNFDHTMKFNENDTSDDKCIRVFRGHTKAVYPLIFIPALGGVPQSAPGLNINFGDLLLTGSADGTARSWVFESGEHLKVFKGHKDGICCMATDPQGKILYTGSYDNSINAWSISSAVLLKQIRGHEGGVTTITIVNKMMYTGSQDGTARSWDREFGDCTRVYKTNVSGYSVTSVKFYKGILFVSATDGVIRSFDAKSGELLRKFRGHEGNVSCITLVDARLYSGSTDRTLRIWNIGQIEGPDVGDNDLESERNQRMEKQSRNLEDLDRRLDGYCPDEFNHHSVPDIVVN